MDQHQRFSGASSLLSDGRKWPQERVLVTDLMKGACWGLMKTNRHTPTSCSEASSTYLLSLETVFWSSTAQSFWFVVLPEHVKKGIFLKIYWQYGIFYDNCQLYLYIHKFNKTNQQSWNLYQQWNLYVGWFLFSFKKENPKFSQKNEYISKSKLLLLYKQI